MPVVRIIRKYNVEEQKKEEASSIRVFSNSGEKTSYRIGR